MTSWSKIVSSDPVDRKAATVAGARGGFTPHVVITDYCPDQPPTRPYQENGSTQCVDFTGRTFGYLKVVGVMVKRSGPTSWVCKCKCGGFCTRKTKTLKDAARNGNVFIDECGLCRYQRDLVTGNLPESAKVKIAARARRGAA